MEDSLHPEKKKKQKNQNKKKTCLEMVALLVEE